MPPASPGNQAARIAGSAVVGPAHAERAGVQQHQCDFRVGAVDRFEQLLLRARQVEVTAVTALGLDLQVGAEAQDDDVRLLRERDRARHGLGIGRADEVAPFS